MPEPKKTNNQPSIFYGCTELFYNRKNDEDPDPSTPAWESKDGNYSADRAFLQITLSQKDGGDRQDITGLPEFIGKYSAVYIDPMDPKNVHLFIKNGAEIGKKGMTVKKYLDSCSRSDAVAPAPDKGAKLSESVSLSLQDTRGTKGKWIKLSKGQYSITMRDSSGPYGVEGYSLEVKGGKCELTFQIEGKKYITIFDVTDQTAEIAQKAQGRKVGFRLFFKDGLPFIAAGQNKGTPAAQNVFTVDAEITVDTDKEVFDKLMARLRELSPSDAQAFYEETKGLQYEERIGQARFVIGIVEASKKEEKERLEELKKGEKIEPARKTEVKVEEKKAAVKAVKDYFRALGQLNTLLRPYFEPEKSAVTKDLGLINEAYLALGVKKGEVVGDISEVRKSFEVAEAQVEVILFSEGQSNLKEKYIDDLIKNVSAKLKRGEDDILIGKMSALKEFKKAAVEGPKAQEAPKAEADRQTAGVARLKKQGEEQERMAAEKKAKDAKKVAEEDAVKKAAEEAARKATAAREFHAIENSKEWGNQPENIIEGIRTTNSSLYQFMVQKDAATADGIRYDFNGCPELSYLEGVVKVFGSNNIERLVITVKAKDPRSYEKTIAQYEQKYKVKINAVYVDSASDKFDIRVFSKAINPKEAVSGADKFFAEEEQYWKNAQADALAERDKKAEEAKKAEKLRKKAEEKTRMEKEAGAMIYKLDESQLTQIGTYEMRFMGALKQMIGKNNLSGVMAGYVETAGVNDSPCIGITIDEFYGDDYSLDRILNKVTVYAKILTLVLDYAQRGQPPVDAAQISIACNSNKCEPLTPEDATKVQAKFISGLSANNKYNITFQPVPAAHITKQDIERHEEKINGILKELEGLNLKKKVDLDGAEKLEDQLDAEYQKYDNDVNRMPGAVIDDNIRQSYETIKLAIKNALIERKEILDNDETDSHGSNMAKRIKAMKNVRDAVYIPSISAQTGMGNKKSSVRGIILVSLEIDPKEKDPEAANSNNVCQGVRARDETSIRGEVKTKYAKLFSFLRTNQKYVKNMMIQSHKNIFDGMTECPSRPTHSGAVLEKTITSGKDGFLGKEVNTDFFRTPEYHSSQVIIAIFLNNEDSDGAETLKIGEMLDPLILNNVPKIKGHEKFLMETDLAQVIDFNPDPKEEPEE